MKSNFYRLLSVVAAFLTVTVFFSGYNSIWQISVDPKKVPLLSTLLSNDGWVNILIYLGCFYAIWLYIDKTKRRRLFLIIKGSRDKWYKEKHIQSVAREIKNLDNKASISAGLLNFSLILIAILFVYNSSLLPSISLNINVGTSDEFLQAKRLDIQGSNHRRFEVQVNGSISKRSEGIIDLAAKLSPIPLDATKEYLYKIDNGVGLYLPLKPMFKVESSWWFIFYIFIFVSPFYIALESHNKYLFLIRVKKTVPKTLDTKKIQLLAESINSHDFKNSDIKSFSENLIKLLNKRSDK